MHQTTPFNKEDEALAEFNKVFRQKSGNYWENRRDFVEVPKKYKLVEDGKGDQLEVSEDMIEDLEK